MVLPTITSSIGMTDWSKSKKNSGSDWQVASARPLAGTKTGGGTGSYSTISSGSICIGRRGLGLRLGGVMSSSGSICIGRRG